MDISPEKARQFAQQAVRQLREAGHLAYWAGGCVRDSLLGLEPVDYDVATSAHPEEVRQVFGKRKTIPVGAAFGVITVLGPPLAGKIEVATFRQDALTSDGRRPDHVVFSDPREDAHRRDFTINGMFFDPIAEQVIDYVGGQEDLKQGLVRAIGEPNQRFNEDKLRLMRAVRFTATYGFRLEEKTWRAVCERAGEIHVVSQERITGEMRRMLDHPYRHDAMELLRRSGLLAEVLPESKAICTSTNGGSIAWQRAIAVLQRLIFPTFAVALSGLVREMFAAMGTVENATVNANIRAFCRRWKLSNDESERIEWLLENEPLVRRATEIPYPQLQRVLVHPGSAELLKLAEAVAAVMEESPAALEYCHALLSQPRETLDPPPLLTGDDLHRHGVPRGPDYRRLLTAVRDAQLVGTINDRAGALALVDRLR